MSLAELGDHVAHSTHDVKVGTAFIKMAVELHGYLQQSLQGCGMGRMLMPQARSNGFEVWRLLHERFKPHTAVSALADLREVMLQTNLFAKENFTQGLLEWEHKLAKFTERYEVQVPDLFKYLVLMNNAPHELQSHVCLNFTQDALR